MYFCYESRDGELLLQLLEIGEILLQLLEIGEILLQLLEHTHIKLDTKLIILYTRYIDDILVIYDAAQINLDTIMRYANPSTAT